MHLLNWRRTNGWICGGNYFLAMVVAYGGLLAAWGHLLSLPEAGGVHSRFQAMPLLFESAGENWFSARAPGFGLQVGPREAQMRLWPALLGPEDGLGEAQGGLLRLRWLAAAEGAGAEAEGAMPTRLNYFLGRDPAQWRTNVTAYQRVRYREVYPGIDVVYYGNDRQLQYDLWVSPGADPGVAKFWLEGAGRVEVEAGGDLLIEVVGAQVRQRRPIAFQWAGLHREEVEVGFVLEQGNPPTVGFRVGEYDCSRGLVIDPVVLHAAYFGGSGYDLCRRLLVTSSGALVVTGETTSTNLPVLRPLFDTTVTYVTNTLAGGVVQVTEVTVTNVNGAVSGGGPGLESGNPLGNEAFVAGFSADGRELEFATYLGGGAIDAALDVAEDAEGNLLVFGLTQSADFPVVTHPEWSGMAIRREGSDGAGDGTGTAGGGWAVTNAWPVPEGWDPVWKPNISGEAFWGYYPLDAFLAVLSSTGDQLLFSGYQGGVGSDQGMRLAVGEDGRLFLVSAQGLSSVNLGQPWVLGIRSNRLVYASAPLEGFALSALPTAAAAGLGEALWIAGQARPVSDEAVRVWREQYGCLAPLSARGTPSFQCDFGGGRHDAFLMRLDATGRADYFTLLGGTGDEVALAVITDGDGGVTVVGDTTSTNFPVRGAIKPMKTGSLSDGFVTRFDATLTNLVFSTYVGQDEWSDSIQAAVLGPGGALHLAGWTESPYSPLDWAEGAESWGAVRAGDTSLPALGGLNGLLIGLTADGSRVLYGGIMGGDGDDQVWDIGVGKDNTLWVAGQTYGWGTNYGGLVSTNWWMEPDPAVRQLEVWRRPAGFVARVYPGSASLTMAVSGEGLPLVSWPALWAGYELESSGVLGGTIGWRKVEEIEVSGTNRVYTVTDPAPGEYFRLRRP